MSNKLFRLENGVTFETPQEIDAYVRGLELARLTSQGCVGGREEFLGKVATLLEYAHNARAAGLVEEKKPEVPPEPVKEEVKADA